MKVIVNEETKIKELHYPATLVSVSATVRHTDNDKHTPYRLAQAEVEYPNGTKGKVGAMIWDASYQLFPEEFAKGSDVTLRVQAEGDYAGNAVIALPTMNKFDLSLVGLEELIAEQA